MESTEKTCREIISSKLKSREKDYEDLIQEEGNALEEGDYDKAGMRYGFAAGISKYAVLKIEISGGGPADWLEAYVDIESSEPEMFRLEYHYSDWFDHAQLLLSEDSPLFSLAEELVYITFNI